MTFREEHSALSGWRLVWVEASGGVRPRGGSLSRQQCTWWKHKWNVHKVGSVLYGCSGTTEAPVTSARHSVSWV